MNLFSEMSTKELDANAFKMIGNDWMLITAQNNKMGQQAASLAMNNQVNTMTASWGGFGVMWGKDVAFIVIRPQRYTKEFIDSSDTFSLCFFTEKEKSILAYCGKVSGRVEDKISKSNLTIVYDMDTPYFEEAKTVLLCKKLYQYPLVKEGFIDPELYNHWYSQDDIHTLYIAEISKVLINQNK